LTNESNIKTISVWLSNNLIWLTVRKTNQFQPFQGNHVFFMLSFFFSLENGSNDS